MEKSENAFGHGSESPAVDPALLEARELIIRLLARPGYAFSNAEVSANLRAVHALVAVTEATRLALVAELDSRPEMLPGIAPSKVAATSLQEVLLLAGPQANQDVAAARALHAAEPELALMGQALAAGEVSREHVDVAVSTLRRIPKALKTKLLPPADDVDGQPEELSREQRGAEAIDKLLTGQAKRLPPSTIDVLGRQIVHRLDPERAERFDADAFERRSSSYSRDFAGMGLYRLVLDPATDALVQAAIARFSAPHPARTAVDEHGQSVTVKDRRTPGQRRADAMADLILAGAGTRPQAADRHQPSPDGHDEMDDGTVAARTSIRWCCSVTGTTPLTMPASTTSRCAKAFRGCGYRRGISPTGPGCAMPRMTTLPLRTIVRDSC